MSPNHYQFKALYEFNITKNDPYHYVVLWRDICQVIIPAQFSWFLLKERLPQLRIMTGQNSEMLDIGNHFGTAKGTSERRGRWGGGEAMAVARCCRRWSIAKRR